MFTLEPLKATRTGTVAPGLMLAGALMVKLAGPEFNAKVPWHWVQSFCPGAPVVPEGLEDVNARVSVSTSATNAMGARSW